MLGFLLIKGTLYLNNFLCLLSPLFLFSLHPHPYPRSSMLRYTFIPLLHVHIITYCVWLLITVTKLQKFNHLRFYFHMYKVRDSIK